MPITPLHLGVLAPLNHWFPGKVNNLAFWIVTLWLDASAIGYYAFGLEMGEFHGPETHSFIAATAIAGMVSIPGFIYYLLKMLFTGISNEKEAMAWLLGSYLGGLSHILLDAMVHSEMFPFYPMTGNPFYWGDMEAVSLVLVLPLIWLIFQYVSYTVGLARKSLADWQLLKR